MMHPPAQPKRRRAVLRVPPAGVVKMEAEEAASGDTNYTAHKHVKAVHPSSPKTQVDAFFSRWVFGRYAY